MAWLLRFSHNLPKVSKRYNLRRLGKRETNESSDELKTPSRGGCVEAANPPHSARVRRPVKSFTGSWSGTGPGALWKRGRVVTRPVAPSGGDAAGPGWES